MAKNTRPKRPEVEDDDEPVAKKPKSDLAMIAEVEDGLMVDKNALDEALVQQPDLFYRVSKILVERISQRDAAKQDHAEQEAKVDAELRRDAELAGDKMTADQVKAAIKIDRRCVKTADALADLNYKVGQWGALKEAFLQRSHVLRDLVSLYSANYYSDASMGRSKSRVNAADGDQARQALARARRGADRDDD